MTCRGRFVLRQSRLHSGLAQVFLALFALLAILAPTFDVPRSGNEFEEYVAAPADTRGDAAALLGATLGVAEDLEEEEDQEEATFLAFATLHCAADAAYRATDAWVPAFPRLSGHSCTGPPTL
jgi:hypothetical protein